MRFSFCAGMIAVLMDKAGEGGSGGGGSGGSNTPPEPTAIEKKAAELEAANKKLEERLAKLEAGGNKPPPPAPDPSLEEKAKLERDAKEKQARDSKAMEKALQFTMGSKEWLRVNEAILPKEIAGIFEAAEKENYASAIEKNAAIKSSVVSTFFKLQSNLDLLTTGQKSAIEEFLKLTKNGREEQASQLYETVFEPTVEMIKRIKKAEQLGSAGHASNSSDATVAYTARMKQLSEKHYTGRKADA